MPANSVSRRGALFVAALLLLYCTILVASRFLQWPAYGDELHFWPSTQELFRDGFPSLARLRDYPELNTPLPFVVFGLADRLTGAGITSGRAVDFILSFTIVLTIAASGRFERRAALSIVGLLLFPYFLFTSVYLYTDIIAVLFTVAGGALALSGRHWLAGLCFVLGIASRQYIIAFPIALLAGLGLQALDDRRWSALVWRGLPYGLAALSMVGWYIFFGGAAPRAALTGQSITAGHLYPGHGLYFLTTIGAFFVVIEAVLFRRLRIALDAPRLALVAVVIVGFVLFPPAENVNTITDTMGYLDRAVRLLLPDSLRLAVFGALAVLTCLRFDPRSTVGLMVYANAVMMAAAHVGWDKYAMPLLAMLWLMQSAGVLDAPARVGLWAAARLRTASHPAPAHPQALDPAPASGSGARSP